MQALAKIGATVAPFAGAWIEIHGCGQRITEHRVAPFAGAWIEIASLHPDYCFYVVAPFAGAWIEIYTLITSSLAGAVAPFAGAWIEIFHCGVAAGMTVSLPSRERGLKSIISGSHQ